MRRALISVSDKTGVLEFARKLSDLGFEIVSTGGTSRLLTEGGVKVTAVSEVTGFPEILDGRVKTLHPRVHAGILARRDDPSHLEELSKHNIDPIDIVVVNLYPFQETVQKGDASSSEIIENIDIGGPSMIRAAAKNFESTAVVVESADYPTIIDELKHSGQVSLQTRRYLAKKAFCHTAAYDAFIADYFCRITDDEFPETLTRTFRKVQGLRYGENPHQRAAFYAEPIRGRKGIMDAVQLHGKELSYNNIKDADAAIALLKEFSEPTAIALKHTNPCGVGTGKTVLEAFEKAYASDPVSIFGGIVAVNRVVDDEAARLMHKIFLEIVLAPGFDDDALDILKSKKNLRLLKLPQGWEASKPGAYQLTGVAGGLLLQDEDEMDLDPSLLQVVTERAPSDKEMEELRFGWKVVKHVKSNAIVLVKDGGTIGVGAGQMNRVGAAVIAIRQAGEKAKGSVLASDAFFPMPDTVEEAARAGVTAIIQPGGSIKDSASIEAANRHGMAMIFTGMRHFKH